MTHLARIAALVTNVPLMLQPSKLAVIASILDGRIGIDAAGLPADTVAKMPTAPQSNRYVGQYELNDPQDQRSGRKPYRTTRNGVAIIPVLGSLVNRGGWLDAISGLTSYETLKHHIRLAAADLDVAGIVLDIDSPGGEAIGAFEAADAVAAAKAIKPVIASVTGLACSAAYAIASACTKIVVSPSSVVGSIGVVMLHIDRSRRMDNAGLTPTLIHAGARKVDGHPYGPLSDEVTGHLQAEIDRFYDLFVATVARGRGISEQSVRDTEARTYIGADAISVGLADQVGSFEDFVAELDRASPIAARLAERRKPRAVSYVRKPL